MKSRIRRLPTGWQLDNVVLWGETLSRQHVLSMPFELRVPDLGSLGTEARNEWHEGWRAFLAGLSPDLGVQLQTYDGGDYSVELEAFEVRTRKHAEEEAGWARWGTLIRDQRVESARREQREGKKRRDRTVLWVGRKAGAGVPRMGFTNGEDSQAFVRSFEEAIRERVASLEGHLCHGASLVPILGEGIDRELARFFRPGSAEMLGGAVLGRDIVANYLRSDGAGISLPEGGRGFWVDGMCHSIVVLTGWPEMFYPGLALPVMRSWVRNKRIVQTFVPRDSAPERVRLQRDIGRLKNMADTDEAARTALKTAQQRMEELASGRVVPFGALTMAVVWGSTAEECQRFVNALKVEFGSMGGAAYRVSEEPTQAVELYCAALPGRVQHNLGGADGWEQSEVANRLAAMVCASNNFEGALAKADALYDTPRGGLAGVSLWMGEPEQPQHAFVIGTRGGGKSVFTSDLLSQALPSVAFAVVVDEGKSQIGIAAMHNAVRIVPHPAAESLCINRFDPLGLPLSEASVIDAGALLLSMAGADGMASEEAAYRRSILEAAIWESYEDCIDDDWMLHETHKLDAAALAQMVLGWREQTRRGAQMSPIEAYADLMQMRATVPEEFDRLWAYHRAPERETDLLNYVQTEQGLRLTRQIGCSFLPPDSVPTLSLIVGRLEEGLGIRDPATKSVAARLGMLLRKWCVGGSYGRLFDGPSTVDLGARLLYFDLSELGADNADLKRIMYRLILAQVRNRVLTMPRALRKLVWLEEAGRLIEHPEGLSAVEEFYAQMRKYNVVAASVIQTPKQLGDSTRAKGLLDNVSQYFITRPANPQVARQLGDVIGLPDIAVEEMQGFPDPATLPPGERAAFVLHATNWSGRMNCGVLRVRVSREMLWVAESSGSAFDRREEALARYDDPVTAVLNEVFLEEAATAT